MHEQRSPIAGVLAMLMPLWMLTGCMATSEAAPEDGQTAQIGELPGAGPYGRFIVKYREGAAQAADPELVPERLHETAVASGVKTQDGKGPVRLEWVSRMGVGADVFKTGHPLERDAAKRLMEQFAADPQVEYIEADRMMTIPGRGG